MTFLRRSPAFYVPLTLALLGGLVLSLLPSTPALSDTVPACVGGSASASPSTAHVSLSGQPVAPALLFQAAIPGQPCAAGTTPASLVTLSRTVIVSPGSANDPAQNGTALLNAMSFISNASPSATNPYLLKVEPGNYSITTPLTLLPYVDLEGSGEDITTISSTVGNQTSPTVISTLVAASNSEIRFIKIVNSGIAPYQIAVNVPTGTINSQFTHSSANANSAFNGYGFANSGAITITNSTISASSTNSNSAGNFNDAHGFVNRGTAYVSGSNFKGVGVGGFGTGIFNVGSQLTVTDSILAGSSNNLGYGLYVAGTSQVISSQLSGTKAASANLTVCPFSVNGGSFIPLNASCQ